MDETITLRWSTGSMELVPSALLKLNAAQLKKIVSTATLNADEVQAKISAYIQSEIDELGKESQWNKKTIEAYRKLIAVCGDRKYSKQEKAAIRIIKNVSDARPQFSGMFQDAGKYCILDGYRLVRLSAPIDGVKQATGTFDTAKAVGSVSNYTVKLELLALKDLKADIKLAKIGCMDVNRVHVKGRGRSMTFLYDFGYGLPAVDAAYLVDMMEALPDCEAFLCETKNARGHFVPIYFVSGENDGLLCPFEKSAEWEPAPVVEKPVNTTPVMEAPAEAVSTDMTEDPAPIPDIPAEIAPTPAPVATSAPVQAAQDTETREARQIVAAINPAFLRLLCASVWDGCRPDKTGLDRTKPDKSGVSARWTVDGTVMHNTS